MSQYINIEWKITALYCKQYEHPRYRWYYEWIYVFFKLGYKKKHQLDCTHWLLFICLLKQSCKSTTPPPASGLDEFVFSISVYNLDVILSMLGIAFQGQCDFERQEKKIFLLHFILKHDFPTLSGLHSWPERGSCLLLRKYTREEVGGWLMA